MSYKLTKKFNESTNEWIFIPEGDIDIHNSSLFKDEVINSYKEKNAEIVIDGKDLVYVDSTGLGAFITIYKEINSKGHKIIFENIRKFVLKLLKITDMNSLFIIRSEFNE